MGVAFQSYTAHSIRSWCLVVRVVSKNLAFFPRRLAFSQANRSLGGFCLPDRCMTDLRRSPWFKRQSIRHFSVALTLRRQPALSPRTRCGRYGQSVPQIIIVCFFAAETALGLETRYNDNTHEHIPIIVQSQVQTATELLFSGRFISRPLQ